MATPKTILFGEDEIQLAALAKGLSHPARIQILMTLICNEFCNCCDLVEELPLAQSTVSQHLKALKELGLIEMTTDRQKSNYKLSPKAFENAIELLEGFLARLKKMKGPSACKTKAKIK